jgi:hypothetical protein
LIDDLFLAYLRSLCWLCVTFNLINRFIKVPIDSSSTIFT